MLQTGNGLAANATEMYMIVIVIILRLTTMTGSILGDAIHINNLMDDSFIN